MQYMILDWVQNREKCCKRIVENQLANLKCGLQLENSTASMPNFLSLDNSTAVTGLILRKFILKNSGVSGQDIVCNLLSDSSTKLFIYRVRQK